MKKYLLILTMIISAFCMARAQGEEPSRLERNRREVHEFKMKYLAQEMELSEAQKKKFFELYKEMSKSKQDCYKEAVEMKHRLKEEKNASEEDYQKVTESFNTANTNWINIEKEYDAKFAEFLTQKQIYKMKEAEENYRSRLEEMKHNRRKLHGGKTER